MEAAILLPAALPVPKAEVEADPAILEAVFALLEPCFCCLRENPAVLSLENSRLFLSVLLKKVTLEAVMEVEAEIVDPTAGLVRPEMRS